MIRLSVRLIIVCLLILATGCVSSFAPKGGFTEPSQIMAASNRVDLLSASMSNHLATLERVNDATAAVNPLSPFITIGLGAVASLLGLYSTYIKKKLSEESALLTTVIKGVENAGAAKETTVVKAAISSLATKKGVGAQLNDRVQATLQ